MFAADASTKIASAIYVRPAIALNPYVNVTYAMFAAVASTKIASAISAKSSANALNLNANAIYAMFAAVASMRIANVNYVRPAIA